jgi:class 3 adenylate cyclase
MFIDVVDSTKLSEQIDPETFFGIMQRYYAICESCAQRYGGELARSFGDGLLFYYGFPQAHEDDAERAVQAGLAIIDAVKAETFETREIGEISLKVRIAVSTGPVVLGPTGRIGTDVFGTSVVVAARLQGLAPANSIVIGATTHGLVRGAFECEPLGSLRIKGIASRIEAWRVVAQLSSESRFARRQTSPLTPMSGRSEQLAQLQALWRQAAAGDGRVVTVSGEPGIGKSRLLLEFRNSIKDVEHYTVFLQCSPLHINTPVAPVIDQVKRDARIDHADAPEQALAKVANLLARSVGDANALLPYYGAILSIPAHGDYRPADVSLPGEREKMLRAIAGVPVAMARQRPVLLIIEDAHWLDPTSRRLVSLAMSAIGPARVLCVITSRGPLDVVKPRGVSLDSITLSRLDAETCAEMIDNVAGGIRLPRVLLNRVVQRTDGIPLIVEELTHAVLQSGALERVGDRFKIRKTLPEPVVPATIQDSLRERLDRLGSAKSVAQVASVLGREFTLKGLHHVSGLSEQQLAEALGALAASGLIRQRSESPEGSYVFNHAMMQEEAYDSLLQETKRAYHERAGTWLAGEIAGRESEQVAVLAYHFSRAESYEKAAAYWLEAGKAALRRSAHKEAITHLDAGLQTLRNWPKRAKTFEIEIELQLHLAMSYIGFEGWSGRHTDAAYRRALELSRSHGNLRQKSMALWGVSRSLLGTDLQGSLRLAREYLALAEATGDMESALMAHVALTTSNFYLGNLVEARRSVEFVLKHYRERAHRNLVNRYQHDPKIIALVFGGHIYWLLGKVRRGRTCCQQARLLAHRVGHPFMLALTYVIGAADHLYNHEVEANWASIQEGMRHAQVHGLIAYREFGPLWGVEAAMARDSSAENLEWLAGCLSRLQAYDVKLTVPFYQARLAAQMVRFAQYDRALALVSQAVRTMEKTREKWFEPEIHRVRGALLMARKARNWTASETAFQRSLREAQRSQALGWELRTALSYADYLDQQKRPAEANALLRRVTAKFDARESSPELDQARRLLRSADHKTLPIRDAARHTAARLKRVRSFEARTH